MIQSSATMQMYIQPTKTVAIIIPGGAISLDITGPMEVFSTADGICRMRHKAHPYALILASPEGGILPTRTGVDIVTRPISALVAKEIDTVLVIGGADAAGSTVLSQWLRQNVQDIRRVCSICIGAFVLAEAGLLDGRCATTHWRSLERLQKEYPQTDVQSGKIFVRDGKIWTSAGVLAGIDLALQLVEDDLGREIAMRIARLLVTFVRRTADQSQESAVLNLQSSGDPDFSELSEWMLENIGSDLHVSDLAAQMSMTPRTFARRFKQATGSTPADALMRIRLDAARQFMAERQRSMKEIAVLIGFKTETNLRRALQKYPA